MKLKIYDILYRKSGKERVNTKTSVACPQCGSHQFEEADKGPEHDHNRWYTLFKCENGHPLIVASDGIGPEGTLQLA